MRALFTGHRKSANIFNVYIFLGTQIEISRFFKMTRVPESINSGTYNLLTGLRHNQHSMNDLH